MTDVKFCKDCRYFRGNDLYLARRRRFLQKDVLEPTEPFYIYAQCAAIPDLVSGGPKDHCSILRLPNQACGPEGKLWEPRT